MGVAGRGARSRIERLPEPEELAALEAAAGCAFGLPEGRVAVAVPGTDLALRLLARVIDARSPRWYGRAMPAMLLRGRRLRPSRWNGSMRQPGSMT